MATTSVRRLVLSFLVSLFLIPLGVGAASAVASPSDHAYDAPAHVYDGGLNSVQAHTDEVVPVGSHHVSEGAQGTVVDAAGPLSVFLLDSVAANTAEVAAATTRNVDDVLSGLSPGKNPDVWTVPDEAALNQTFSELTEGATPTTWRNYTGQTFERSDGVQVGLRPSSSSGGATIDIRLPDGSTQKVHIS